MSTRTRFHTLRAARAAAVAFTSTTEEWVYITLEDGIYTVSGRLDEIDVPFVHVATYANGEEVLAR